MCGGRDYADNDHLWKSLGELKNNFYITEVAHGGATGADDKAGVWAKANGIPVQVFPANWKQEGKKAGPLRNQRMLDQFKPDAVVAFPGGRGTADMIKRAIDSGVPVIRIKEAK